METSRNIFVRSWGAPLLCFLLTPMSAEPAPRGLAPTSAPQANGEASVQSYGIQMLQAARSHEGAAYGKGMQCSDLVISASRAIGVRIPEVPSVRGETVTQSWFLHGMGLGYRIVVDSVPLSKLAQEEGSGLITIPLGAVIVTAGPPPHAALFNGIVKVYGAWQLITYDANNETGWTVALSGTPSPTDPDDRMLAFPGHRVGDHVTRLQWGPDHLVRVYEPIGNQTGALELTPASPVGEGSVTIVAPGNGLQHYTLYHIDTQAFATGGVLDIEIQIASNSATDGSFDLFPVNAQIPTTGRPLGALASRHDVRKGTSARLEYRFKAGQMFVLALDGNWFSPKGATGTVQIRASVGR